MGITDQRSAHVKMGGWVDNAHYALDQLIIHLEIAHSPDASCPDIGIDRLQPIHPSNKTNVQKGNNVLISAAESVHLLTTASSWGPRCTP